MRATVWTRWDINASNTEGKPKCIFQGEIGSIPRIDEYVIVRDGFCAERVNNITHDFVKNEIEITVWSQDKGNEYGPCLLSGKGEVCATS